MFAAIFLGRSELVGRRLVVVGLLVVAGGTLVGATADVRSWVSVVGLDDDLFDRHAAPLARAAVRPCAGALAHGARIVRSTPRNVCLDRGRAAS